jgi:methylmalonyl-CoA/ethylmalonyl-CoA epimerase
MDFKITGINHIGLAPKDPEKARWFFEEILKVPLVGTDLVAAQKVKTVMLASAHQDLKEKPSLGRLEILEATDDDSPIAKFLEKKGSGIHHLALTVDDIKKTIAYLIQKEIMMVDIIPRSGAHNTQIAFVHPASTGGLLIELVEETQAD